MERQNVFLDFISCLNFFKTFKMKPEDLSYTMSEFGYDVQLSGSSKGYNPKNIPTSNLEDYIAALNKIVGKKQGLVHCLDTHRENVKEISCIYGNLFINCYVDLSLNQFSNLPLENRPQQNLNIELIEIKREISEKEQYIYEIGSGNNNPYLFLLANLDNNVFDEKNFRFSYEEKDKNYKKLFLYKEDAIEEFEKAIQYYSNDDTIGKIDFSAIETKGTIMDLENNPIALLRNNFVSEVIDANFKINEMTLFLKIYQLLDDNDNMEEWQGILSTLGFNFAKKNKNINVSAFTALAQSIGFVITKTSEKAVTLSNQQGYIVEIKERILFPNEIVGSDDGFYLFVQIKSSGGRKYILPSENFITLLAEKKLDLYNQNEICTILWNISQWAHEKFTYTLLNSKNNEVKCYRYSSFKTALMAREGFYALSKGNDNISLDVANRVGKSYKVNTVDQKKYDYVCLDRNDNITKIYAEIISSNPNYQNLKN